MKVITILGTRPELIRLSRVLARLQEHADHILVHTGQNYDYELNEVFFSELGIQEPNYFLGIDTSSLGKVLGEILIKVEEVLQKEKPDAILILGDTNSSIAGIIAKRMRIPIFHMEAGNRCFDQNVPEEINRKIIDHVADFNLVYTEHARRHLLSEGMDHRRIYLTGSPIYEVLAHYKNEIDSSKVLDELQLKKNGYYLVSFHREENIDNRENLESILNILATLDQEEGLPIIVSTHPRTKKRLDQHKGLSESKNISFLKPFGFYDYVKLQKNSKCVLSDSGTISEESAMLSFPAISLRKSMERPEAMDAGTIILSGLEPKSVCESIATVVAEHQERSYQNIPAEYQVEDTSWRVLKLIKGLAFLNKTWSGLIEKE